MTGRGPWVWVCVEELRMSLVVARCCSYLSQKSNIEGTTTSTSARLTPDGGSAVTLRLLPASLLRSFFPTWFFFRVLGSASRSRLCLVSLRSHPTRLSFSLVRSLAASLPSVGARATTEPERTCRSRPLSERVAVREGLRCRHAVASSNEILV